MAKAKYTLTFLGTDIQYEDIKLVMVPEKPDVPRRFWVEFEGERARVMVSKDVVETMDDRIVFDITRYNEHEMPAALNTPIGSFPFTMYNVILGRPEAKKFYYIDEYQPSQLRLTHSKNFFPENFKHDSITGYELRKANV